MVNCTTSTGNDVDSKMVVSLLFLFLISVFAIFGNGLVCAAFAKNRSLRILTNYYVVSLAVSDILVGAINIPIWMYIRAYNLCVPPDSYLLTAYTVFDVLTGTASIWNMTVISIDRFMAVTYPTAYKRRLKKKSVALWFLIFIWIFSVIVACLRIIYKLFNYAMFVVTVSFFIPLVIILFSYGFIYRVVSHRAKWTGSVLMEIKLARTLSIVIGAFILCWGPFFILNIVSYYCRDNCQYGVAVQVIKWLQYASACVNPVVYTVRNREFRYAFHKLVFQCRKRNGKYVISPTERRETWCGRRRTSLELENRPRLPTYTEESAVSILNNKRPSPRGRKGTFAFDNAKRLQKGSPDKAVMLAE